MELSKRSSASDSSASHMSHGVGDTDDVPASSSADGDRQGPAGDQESGDRRRTFWAVAVAFMLEKADENVLPTTFDGLGASLRADPQQLGYLSLSRGLTTSLISPFVGLLGHMVDRRKVVAAGCVLWGASTCLMALCNSIVAAALMCGINGIGIALVMPAGQSLVADYYSDSSRGKAYGGIHAIQALGAMLGVIFTTNIAAREWFGFAGWRAAWIGIGLCGLLASVLFATVAQDPNQVVRGKVRLSGLSARGHLQRATKAARDILRCPSFVIIVGQGIAGVWPFQALNYTMLYLELLNISKFHSSLIAVAFMAGAGLGGLVGGSLGDRAARAFPNHGRILVSSFSTFLAVPWCCTFFKGLPRVEADAHAGLYAAVLFAAGMSITWLGVAGKQPICAEIVPPQHRHLIFALSRFFEGTPAALGAPLVGWTAKAFFGYTGLATTSQECASQDCREFQGSMTDLEKAEALGSAMLLMTAGPWFLCAAIWSGLHLTYPRDRRKVASTQEAPTSGSSSRRIDEQEERLLGLPADSATG